MIRTKILDHLEGNSVRRLGIYYLDQLDYSFHDGCDLAVFKTEEISQQTILLGTEQKQDIEQMRLLPAEMNDMTTAVVHDERHTVVAFRIALLDLLGCRIALFLNDNGSRR